MNAALRSIGLATPARSLSQREFAELTARTVGLPEERLRALRRLYEATAIERRGSVLLGNDPPYPPARDATDPGPGTGERLRPFLPAALELSERACRDALGAAGIEPAVVTHVVSVSCTGFAAPGVEIGLIERLGLRRTTQRLSVGFMGCHGAINGLAAARALALGEPGAVVLLNAVELCSLHFSYASEPERSVGNALFADGAAAAVVTATDERTDGAPRLAGFGTVVVPGSGDAMGWQIGDFGFEMTLSRRVPEELAGELRPFLAEWLARHELRTPDIRSWAVHPGGPKVLDEAARTLGLPSHALDASRAVLREHGNMSSPTVLFVLDRLLRARAELPCVLLAFGPGLVAEAALLL